MALDRQSIEKKDFPIGRRGYEPEAVDAHLSALAAEVERLQGGSSAGAPSLATTAAEQVRAIVEAAETSAGAIERAARADAERIRGEAQAEAAATREAAVARSEEHVGQVAEATKQMLGRIEAMETELGGLLGGLRTGATRLDADLSLLKGSMSDLHAASPAPEPAPAPAPAAPPVAAPEPAAPAAVEQPTLPEIIAAEDPVEDPAADAPMADPGPVEDPSLHETVDVGATHEAPAAGADEDVEGARLIALNMALDGASREETDQYLSEHFALSDRAGLLDEVYATVG